MEIIYNLQDISHPRDSVTMLDSKEIMKFKAYQNQANLFVKEYLLADPLIPYTSIVGGVFACKMVCCIILCCYSISLSISPKRIQFHLILFISTCSPVFQIYDLTQLFSTIHFKSYSSLTKIQRIEWNNRSVDVFI